jgi:hypothetical protein
VAFKRGVCRPLAALRRPQVVMETAVCGAALHYHQPNAGVRSAMGRSAPSARFTALYRSPRAEKPRYTAPPVSVSCRMALVGCVWWWLLCATVAVSERGDGVVWLWFKARACTGNSRARSVQQPCVWV